MTEKLLTGTLNLNTNKQNRLRTCVVTVYTCLKIYLYKNRCLFLSIMLHSLACFIMGLLNMLQIHGFVYTLKKSYKRPPHIFSFQFRK